MSILTDKGYEYVAVRNDFDLERGFRIYRNLHRHCWSVQAWNKRKGGWRVLLHCTSFRAHDVTFKVSEAGRLRAQAEQRKNVHAFLTCKRLSCGGSADRHYSDQQVVSYTPWGPFPYFTDENALRVDGAAHCHGTRDMRLYLYDLGHL